MIVSLTGGLGNQLFQMFAGLFFEKNQVRLTSNFGSPRETYGRIDLFHFELPPRIELMPSEEKGKLAQKVGGLAIRRGLLPNSLERSCFSEFILNSAMNVYFSSKLRERVKVFSSTEVGLSSSAPDSNDLIFGYFQTYKYYQALSHSDRIISLQIKTRKFLELKDVVEKDRPVIVHIRLGDYTKEKHFGTLSASYYSRALKRLGIESSNSPIWVFSDDPKNALNFLPNELNNRFFVVPDKDLSPAETLELMRYGSAYVIANSSFSWWGATLSHTNNSRVVAPDKWFAGMQDPQELLPSNWMTEQR